MRAGAHLPGEVFDPVVGDTIHVATGGDDQDQVRTRPMKLGSLMARMARKAASTR